MATFFSAGLQAALMRDDKQERWRARRQTTMTLVWPHVRPQPQPLHEKGSGTDQEPRDTNELKAGSLHSLELEVAVNEVDREVQRLRYTPELLVHLNLWVRGNAHSFLAV